MTARVDRKVDAKEVEVKQKESSTTLIALSVMKALW